MLELSFLFPSPYSKRLALTPLRLTWPHSDMPDLVSTWPTPFRHDLPRYNLPHQVPTTPTSFHHTPPSFNLPCPAPTYLTSFRLVQQAPTRPTPFRYAQLHSKLHQKFRHSPARSNLPHQAPTWQTPFSSYLTRPPCSGMPHHVLTHCTPLWFVSLCSDLSPSIPTCPTPFQLAWQLNLAHLSNFWQFLR